MPYTKKEDREKFEPYLQNLLDQLDLSDSKGDLTYIAYKIALEWIKVHGESYTNISSVISSLIDAAEELRRKKLNPYEDQKCKENGEVI
jgi:hypothetical protein